MNNYAIGSPTNLLRGLSPHWNPVLGQLDILYPTKKTAMDTRNFTITAPCQPWSFPSITLHENARDLLDQLIPYQLLNPSSIDAPSIGAGALLIGMQDNQQALHHLSKTLGVDLSDDRLRYALVKINRKDGSDYHEAKKNNIFIHALPKNINPEYRLTEAFVSASRQLPHANLKKGTDKSNLNLKKAEHILEFFEEFGTHYISGIDFGDAILQVFAYSVEKFEKIKQAYANGNPFLGWNASYFMQYTTDATTGIFGYVTQYGHILCLSNSEAFKESLKNNAWYESLWSNKNSVFALLSNQGSPITYEALNKNFIDQVPITIQLTSLCMMIEQKRALWLQRIFKAAALQKYRSTIQANLTIRDTRDFNTMLPDEALLSFLATPNINLYKAKLNIAELQFVAPEQVKEIILFANVLSTGNKKLIRLPGKKISLVAQTLDMRAEGAAKAIQVDDAAFDELEMVCNEFLGMLTIENISGTAYTVVYNGLKFGLRQQETGLMPFIERDIRTTLPRCLPSLINNLELSMTFAEAVISDQTQSKSALQRFIIQYLQWVATLIPAHTKNEDALALRVRVMDLNYQVHNRFVGSFVPLLPYQDYAPFVEQILDYLDRIRLELAINEEKISARHQKELIIDTTKTLNDNLIASGQLISQIIATNIAQQNDLDAFYQLAIEAKEKEAAKQQQTLNSLNLALIDAQNQTQVAVQQYKTAVERWEIDENIKFGLNVATDLFSLGVHFAVPASSISATKELFTLAQYIQKTLNVLNASAKLYTDIQTKKTLENAQKALNELGDAPHTIFNLPWDEMTIHFNAILAIGPDVKTAKAKLQEAFSIMVLRGKAVMSASSSLRTIQRDIYRHRQQTQLNQRQAQRLEQLKQTLKPKTIAELDKENIDLIGMSSCLSAIQNQMLAVLAQAFVWQDQALQYANLQPATPITSFSLLKFSASLVKQKQTTLEAKSKLLRHHAMKTKPINFIITGVRPEEIMGNHCFKCTIRLDAPEFYPYVDVKVVSVIAAIDGVQCTDSNDYIVKLVFTGSFQDRDLNRNPLTFRTPYRERLYSYKAKNHHPNFSDAGKTWSKNVSRVTPFSTWEISLPGSLNKGIRFSKTVLTIRLSFVLEARIIDIDTITQPSPFTYRPSLPPQISKETLIDAMYDQGSCTNGWDVVFNLSLSQINQSLALQYEELKNKTQYKNEIHVETQDSSYPGVTLMTRFTIYYGYPKLIFNANNSTAFLESAILPESSIQRCTIPEGGEPICKAVETIAGNVLSAVIELSLVHGVVEGKKVLSVSLEMEKGSFSISNIDLNDQTKVDFNQSVKAYFVQNKVSFLINQLDLESIPISNDLKPSNFIFKPLKTKNGHEMLQLYIMTGGRPLLGQANAYLNNIPEPLPLSYSNSLIIRSGLVFKHIMPISLKKKEWVLNGVDPNKETQAWSSQFSQANVSAHVDLSSLDHSYYPQGGGSFHTSYTIEGGNYATFSLANTFINVQKDGQLYYSGNKKQTIHLIRETRSYYLFQKEPSIEKQSLSTDFSLKASAYLNFVIGGNDRNQTIELKTDSKTVSVEGHLSGGGPCSSDDLAAQVNQKVREQIPDQIKSQLEMEFEPIAMFALKNLLFPSNNYIQLCECMMPGDLLLLGKFN